MKTYYITYRSSSDHDCTTVWTKASSEEDAIDYVKSEYWDIEEILDVYTKPC